MWRRDIVYDVYAIKTKSGDWYYSSKAPMETNGGAQYHIEYFTNSRLDTVGKSINSSDIADLEASRERKWRAPQSIIAREALQRLRSLADGNWESQVLDTLTRISEDNAIDPTMKYYLLSNVAKMAARFSAPLANALDQH